MKMPQYVEVVIESFYTDERLRSAIVYLVRAGKAMGIPPLGRTQLVKLLFIADYRSMRRQKRTISGVEYTYRTHGPFASDILLALEEMDGYEIVEVPRHFATDTEEQLAYSYLAGDSPRFEAELPKEDREIIEEVLIEFGSRPLSVLLEYVYDMKPMEDVEPFDIVLSDAY